MERIIQKILRAWKAEAGVKSPIQFKYTNKIIYSDDGTSYYKYKKLVVYTSQPGFLIGYHGSTLYKYAAELIKEDVISVPEDISFEETNKKWV